MADFLYKILSIENWEASKEKNTLQLDSNDTAFIHLALKEQVEKILSKYWHDIEELVIVKLDTKKLSGDLLFETNPGGSTKYYHLYNGTIPKEAIVESRIVFQTINM